MPGSRFSSLFDGLSEKVDKRIGWHRLPMPVGLLTLIGLRDRLREQNLYDTGRGETNGSPAPPDERQLNARTIDGSYNDLDDPLMGSKGSRFGRNVPLRYTKAEAPEQILDPNPRLISRELLTRDEFQPATTLNLLAGAWIQFEVHDWFSHGKGERKNPWKIEVADDDPWPDHPMKVQRTRTDPTADPDGPAIFLTDDSHWWDGSQIYGSDAAFADALRSHTNGKLKIDDTGLPPVELEKHIDLTGVAGNFWVGLALLHSLFMREHNAICEHLHAQHPELDDQDLYDKARLVNSALMAKIHTVDWTPAVIAHPTTVLALRANWWGLEGERLDKLVGRRTSNDVVRGIPGSATDHHGVPYSLTEEFVAVYRMHPLIPDDFSFRSLDDDRELRTATLPDLGALQVRGMLSELSMPDLLYSFGTMHPGRDHAPQLPQVPAALRPARRLADRPRRDRHPPLARARSPALQPVPPALPPAGRRDVRGDDGQPGVGRAAAGDLRRRRAGRPDGRHVRRAEAEGLRVQRHGVPRLHPDGVAPPEERPLLHARLPARGVHAGRARLGRGHFDARRAAAPLPRARAGSPRRREPVRALGARSRRLDAGRCRPRHAGGHPDLQRRRGAVRAQHAVEAARRRTTRPGRWPIRSACSGCGRS